MVKLEKPQFVDTDPNVIVSEMIAFYETATGKTLNPGQAERLLINAFAYRESLIRNAINEAGLLNLVAFSKAPVLDFLGDLVGVTRLAEAPATVDIAFTLVTGHSALVIPQGMRIASTDGKAVFFTSVATSVAVGVNTVTVSCICDTGGTFANGYIAATISNILDPVAGVQSASNSSTSENGSDAETDDQLRERIILAPEKFSNAGSRGAYKFFAFSADPLIIDVEIFSPPDAGATPGVVEIYPLIAASGGTPSPILAKVLASCNGEKVRPTNDTVNVFSPTAVNYAISVDVTLFDTADQLLTQGTIQQNLSDFKDEKRSKLGKDIIIDQIIAAASVKGSTYSISVTSPGSDIILNKKQYANCTGVIVNIIGTNEG